MPTTITPAPDSLSVTIDNPIDGELATAASISNPDTSNFNLGYYVLKRLQHCDGTIRARCDGTFGTPDEKTIRIYPILGFVVIDTAVRFAFKTTNTDIDESDLEGGGVYANNTFYYVYAYIVAGAVTFQISTTAPDVYRIFKSGGTTHKYLFCFFTNGVGNVARFYWDRGTMLLHNERVVVNSAPIVAASVSLATFVPPHAYVALVRSTLVNTAGAAGSAFIGPVPTDVASGDGREIFVDANSTNSECYDLALGEGVLQDFDHIVNAATTSHALSCVGWRE